MRKWSRIFLSLNLVTLLSGCVDSAVTLQQSFTLAIENAAQSEITRMSNHSASYFDYYLPITMGRVQSSDSSVILKSKDTKILLTLDVVNIILNNSLAKSSDLRLVFDESKAMINLVGKSLDSRGYDQSYKAQVFDLENDDYLIVIQTQSALISAKTKVGLVSNTAYEMLRLARTVVIDRPLILANYSNAETINYHKVNLNMFSQMAPESGTVLDMIEGDESDLLDDDYYNTINDSPTEEEILQD